MTGMSLPARLRRPDPPRVDSGHVTSPPRCLRWGPSYPVTSWSLEFVHPGLQAVQAQPGPLSPMSQWLRLQASPPLSLLHVRPRAHASSRPLYLLGCPCVLHRPRRGALRPSPTSPSPSALARLLPWRAYACHDSVDSACCAGVASSPRTSCPPALHNSRPQPAPAARTPRNDRAPHV